jgi:hypothetical protein
MTIRPAKLNDCPAILQLHSLHVRKNFLCAEKCPNYASLLQQPDKHIILVGTLTDGRIIAALSAIKKAFFFRGEKQFVYLLAELKADTHFRESPLIFTLVKRMVSRLQRTEVDLTFYENPTSSAIETQFPYISLDHSLPFQGLQNMFNYLLLPRQLPFKVKIPLTITGYNEAPLQDFYNRCFPSERLCPVIDQLQRATHFTCTQNQNIKAALSVYDSAGLDQQTVVHVPTKPSWGLLRSIRSFVTLHSPEHPEIISRILTVKYFGHEPGHESTLVSLLEHAMHFAWENKYHYVSISTDQEQLLLNNLIRPITRWVFRSTIMVSDRRDHPSFADGLNSASQKR